MILAFSILVASISFLCYKHPPSSWPWPWPFPLPLALCQPALQELVARKRNADAPPTTIVAEDSSPPAEPNEPQNGAAKDTEVEAALPRIARDAPSPSSDDDVKAEQDRKAMPPPPFVVKKPAPPPSSSPRMTRPLRDPSIPSVKLGSFDEKHQDEEEDTDDNDEPSAPSFPAPNSAQRASGGVRGPLPPLHLQAQPQQAGLMAPPSRSSLLPNRGPPSTTTSSSSLTLPPTHSAPPSKPRKKVLLTPGHSPLDWARLASSPNANLRGLPPNTPYLKVPPSLLKQYTGRKGKDAWTALGGKVYNMTAYIPYHPGGEPELMKAAGRDGTRLFGEVHPWVNWEGMLESCLVGVVVEEAQVLATGTLDEMD